MRLLAFVLLVLPVLLGVGLATPTWATRRGTNRRGWSVSDGRLVWRAPGPVPAGDAAVEFWEGDRLLGRPAPSAGYRTFTLENTEVTDPHALAVVDDDPPPTVTVTREAGTVEGAGH
jgi:hypothetical protein